MAQFVVDLNASMPASERFIVRMLDPTHMYVLPHAGQMIKSKAKQLQGGMKKDHSFAIPAPPSVQRYTSQFGSYP
jgi:TFIIH basal transcription factor complex TTD-A subunit